MCNTYRLESCCLEWYQNFQNLEQEKDRFRVMLFRMVPKRIL